MAKTDTPEDEDAILARADEIRSQRAAAAKAELQAKYAPMIELRDSPAFAEVMQRAKDVANGLLDEPNAYTALSSLARTMGSIDMVIPANARPAPEPTSATS